MVTRFDVYLVNLDRDPSGDARNTRPGVVLSPDEMNRNLDSVLIAPLSSTNTPYPTRVKTRFLNGERYIVLDQMRSVDKVRLVKKIGEINGVAQKDTLDRLAELFAE